MAPPISFGLGLSLARAGGAALDADAAAYIAAVETAGATVSGTQKAAIDTFVKTGKSDGWYSKLKRLYLPIWGIVSPNATCAISLTSGTFVGNVTHNTGSVSTTSPTGHFLADATPNSLGIVESDASIWNVLISGTHEFSGCGGVSNSRLLIGRVGITNRAAIPSTSSIVGASTDSEGVTMASRIGSDLSLFQLKASGWITPQTATTADTTALPLFAPAFLGNFNNNGIVPNTRTSIGEYCAYGYGLGMSSTLAEDFSLALKNLIETATTKTIP